MGSVSRFFCRMMSTLIHLYYHALTAGWLITRYNDIIPSSCNATYNGSVSAPNEASPGSDVICDLIHSPRPRIFCEQIDSSQGRNVGGFMVQLSAIRQADRLARSFFGWWPEHVGDEQLGGGQSVSTRHSQCGAVRATSRPPRVGCVWCSYECCFRDRVIAVRSGTQRAPSRLFPIKLLWRICFRSSE
jgi:hypothetical protein